eukprot:NODE_21414_length_754_cov_3.717703.p2 GENE.NODE_21414_length_754_cov_3.717703~~NODE_21414_length_754_cov_3.717703.p2  ORF type:complete len:183 (+),score=33.28 NODE_21414_length_754_cov_3.717703:117-665(+)
MASPLDASHIDAMQTCAGLSWTRVLLKEDDGPRKQAWRNPAYYMDQAPFLRCSGAPAGTNSVIMHCVGHMKITLDPRPAADVDDFAATLKPCRVRCSGLGIITYDSFIDAPTLFSGALGHMGDVVGTAAAVLRDHNWAGFPAALENAAYRIVLQAGRIMLVIPKLVFEPPSWPNGHNPLSVE